jgi:hypothetical protein
MSKSIIREKFKQVLADYKMRCWRCNSRLWIVLIENTKNSNSRLFWANSDNEIIEITSSSPFPDVRVYNAVNVGSVPPICRAKIRALVAEDGPCQCEICGIFKSPKSGR